MTILLGKGSDGVFKKDMLRPNYLGLVSADAKGLGPKAFYPPLSKLGMKQLDDLKKYRDDFKARTGKKLSWDLPDDDCVKFKLYTDAEVEPPYYRATE